MFGRYPRLSFFSLISWRNTVVVNSCGSGCNGHLGCLCSTVVYQDTVVRDANCCNHDIDKIVEDATAASKVELNKLSERLTALENDKCDHCSELEARLRVLEQRLKGPFAAKVNTRLWDIVPSYPWALTGAILGGVFGLMLSVYCLRFLPESSTTESVSGSVVSPVITFWPIALAIILLLTFAFAYIGSSIGRLRVVERRVSREEDADLELEMVVVDVPASASAEN